MRNLWEIYGKSMFETLLKNATVAVTTPQGKGTWAKLDLGLAKGRISSVSQNLDAPAAAIWDLTGLHVLPGLMDTQIHFREPGLEHNEILGSPNGLPLEFEL